MEIVSQLSVFVANEPGILANICGSLSDEKISLRGISVVDHTDHALIRLVVSDPSRAAHLLGESGLFVIESEVIAVSISKGNGSLEKILKILAAGELNVLYLYGTEPASSAPAVIFLNTSDNLAALELLRKKF